MSMCARCFEIGVAFGALLLAQQPVGESASALRGDVGCAVGGLSFGASSVARGPWLVALDGLRVNIIETRYGATGTRRIGEIAVALGSVQLEPGASACEASGRF